MDGMSQGLYDYIKWKKVLLSMHGCIYTVVYMKTLKAQEKMKKFFIDIWFVIEYELS